MRGGPRGDRRVERLGGGRRYRVRVGPSLLLVGMGLARRLDGLALVVAATVAVVVLAVVNARG
ncbi:hypothetical protein Misp02_43660 [Microtetraspora sp. NBRC 16547]|nr:hypothetical protein Misp02_43660 [Microtetraspora sp. NBRC 16547]